MKSRTLIIALTLLLAAGCGPSDEEQQQQQEQARQDSLEQVRQRMEQQRQDSLARARQDSMQQREERRSSVTFSDSGAFTLQVESWRSRAKAQQRADMWKERGYDHAYIVQHGTAETGDVWYRVRLGRVNSREEARQLQQNLKQEYQVDAWIGTAR